MDSATASAIAWVARWRSAGSDEATEIGSARTTRTRPSFWRVVIAGTIRDDVLAASVAGPAGNVVQASNSFTGMPSLR